MEQTLHTPEYDYRRYDRIWQRVAPTLEPYPDQAVSAPAQISAPPQTNETAQTAPVQTTPAQTAPAQTAPIPLTPAQVRQESQLPGAEMNPCCMGTEAQEMLEVLTGYIEEELCDRRYYLALARTAPAWARQNLRSIAEDEGGHAKRLMAVYYLITGQCYRPNLSCGHVPLERWCPALRMRYHAEACGGFNYARSADETDDVCLSRIFQELSADEYRHADMLAAMLERSLQC